LALFVICVIILFLRMNNMKNNEAFLSGTAKISSNRLQPHENKSDIYEQ